MKKQVTSFHGKQKIKDQLLERLQRHYDADEIVKGKYWQHGKGCAIGCAIEQSNRPHDIYQEQTGICWQLALVQDSIFERLPNEIAKEWPIEFTKSVPVGKDTMIAFNKFVLWNIADEKEGLLTVIKNEAVRKILTEVVSVYREQQSGKEVSMETWKDLARRAKNAYAYAYASASADAYASASASAYASASADAYAYADAYADASADAYASASASAYASASASATFQKRILRMREKLLEFLSEL